MEEGFILVCDEAFKVNTNGSVKCRGSFESIAWTAEPTPYPDLTLEQVGSLATAALTLWAICWGIKHLGRLIFNSKAGRF